MKHAIQFILIVVFSTTILNAQTDANIPFRGITIYIDYPDVPAAVTPPQLDGLLNDMDYEEEGVERSFRKYWHDQTRRNVDVQQDIFFYTAPESAAYYETLPWYEGILMWQEALEWVIATYPDYDWDALSSFEAGGSLKSVMIISSAWGPAGVGAAHYPNWTLSNGEKISSIYGSVLRAPWDVANNLFMTLHEGGHGIFRLPDTYDTEYDSGGTSFYTLMSGGDPDVEPIGGPFLAEYNWGYVLEPTAGSSTNYTIRADGDSIVVIRNPHDPFEFFTLEVREKSTIGNSRFPVDLGLLIWHTDTKVNTSNTREEMTTLLHYRHSIEQADGLFELEEDIGIGGNAGDIFLPGNEFTPSSTPNTNWWDGLTSGIEITNLEFVGEDKMQFTITIPEIHEDHYPEIATADWMLLSETPPQAGYEGDKAFDNDLATYYHVPWGNTEPRSHDLVIDLGDEYVVNECYYTANDNLSPPWEGRIENYEIYLSTDGIDWGVPVAAGTFFRTGIRQYILFEEAVGRYLKFAAVNSFDDDVRTSIAEIDLRGYKSSEASIAENPSGQLLLYPNPAKDFLFVKSTEVEQSTIEVFRISGELILTTSLQGMTSIDVSALENGVYFIQHQSATETKVYRFLKN